MKVKWEIVKGNIGTGNYEAIMIRDYGGKKYEPYLLFVHEYDGGFHGTFCSEYGYFQRIDIPYKDVYSYIDEKYHDGYNYKEVHIKAVEYACSLIEKEFYKQVQKILDFLSD